VELSQILKQAALTSGVDVRMHAVGINLMRQVNQQFKGPPPFPMYAYSSKAPYLFGEQEWEDVYNLGGRVLLKGRVPPEVERSVILGDIAKSKSERFQAAKAERDSLVPMRIFLSAILACIFTIVVGRLIRGGW
jgi:hypothetical protein